MAYLIIWSYLQCLITRKKFERLFIWHELGKSCRRSNWALRGCPQDRGVLRGDCRNSGSHRGAWDPQCLFIPQIPKAHMYLISLDLLEKNEKIIPISQVMRLRPKNHKVWSLLPTSWQSKRVHKIVHDTNPGSLMLGEAGEHRLWSQSNPDSAVY